MEVTRLYLVRHGQSAGNAEGRFGGHSAVSLSDLGAQQAALTAGALAKERINFIFSSDLERTLRTAEPLAKLLDLKIQTAEALRERHVGVLEGLTFDEAKIQYPRDYFALINRDISHVIQNGESYRQMLARSAKFLSEILRDHRGRKIAVFAHTGTICFLTLDLLGAITPRTRFTPWLVTSNCGINRFEIRGRNNVRVMAVNDTRHLFQTTGNDSFAGK